MQHDLHATGTIVSIPVQAGYQLHLESMTYELTELFTGQSSGHDGVFGASGYVEPSVAVGSRVEVRPGLVLVASPRLGVEPRLRASWEPFGPSSGTLQGALGLYRQHVVGTSDMRDVSTWFGEPVQSYHPPHDRRHQVNAVASLDMGGFKASARWQFGSGLPFTRPIGFDEAFDYAKNLHDVHTNVGITRLVLDKPFTGRLPMVHRLDVSLEREFEVPLGPLRVQAGVINVYDRQNMFYYDLFTGRRLDQLPLAPYASLTLRSR